VLSLHITFMFILNVVKNPSRSRTLVPKSTSQAFVKNEIIQKGVSGVDIPATSSTTRSQIIGISTEAITAGEALAQGGVLEIFENDVYIADTTNNSNATHTNQRMILTDSLTVNNTGTDDANGVVQQIAVFGPVADKKILVKFV